mmetsp:Transcript_39843/g.67952  ORF Transcript_39843/g.67952 Transcript_39843/m.67952 type:complete len:336 (+) Transcript_39843:113-1120(+)
MSSCIGDQSCQNIVGTGPCSETYFRDNYWGCSIGSIIEIVDSCQGNSTCADVSDGGDIGYLTGSCNAYKACTKIAKVGESIARAEDCCNTDNECFEATEEDLEATCSSTSTTSTSTSSTSTTSSTASTSTSSTSTSTSTSSTSIISTSTSTNPTDTPLQEVGNNQLNSKCGCLDRCQGDCDNDKDCMGNLVCFTRDGRENVPGCSGEGKPGNDYCTDRPFQEYLAYVGNDGQFFDGERAGAFRLGLCEGDCDNDSDCEGDYHCYRRNMFTTVPGCVGKGARGKDYCYDPQDRRKISAVEHFVGVKEEIDSSCGHTKASTWAFALSILLMWLRRKN